MADKGGKTSAAGMKPVPMKLFATWEVEKSSPNCIPRLCSLTLTRLLILKPLENDLTSVILAVKMQSSKRTLRSNEIMVSPNGMLDTEIDLSFSLQYPHFLKRDGNKLQVMLQRRKKYKNRTILGYKTLAIGQVNMAQVLQRSVDRELNLYSDPKERTNKVAQVMVLSLSSQPVDHEENGRVKLRPGEVDRSPDVDMSDDEEADDFQENWSNDELSDSEAPEDERSSRGRKSSRGPLRPTMSRVSAQHENRARLKRRRSFLRRISQVFHQPANDSTEQLTISEDNKSEDTEPEHEPEEHLEHHRNLKQRFLSLLRRFRVSESSDEESTPDEYAPHGSEGPQASHLHMEELRLLEQRNIKQKFISLLRRFKVSEEVLDSEQDQELCDVEAPAPQEIADLFDDLEDLSDSGPEVDTISVLSTPKPKLRPFFTGRGSSTEILDLPRLSPVIARNGSSVGPAGVCYSGFDDFGYSLQDSGRLSDESSKRHDSDSHLDNLSDQEMSDTPVSMPIPVHQSASPGLQDKYRRTPSMDGKYGRSPAIEDKFARSNVYDDKLSAGASSSSSPHSPYSPRPRQAIPERSKSMLEKKRVITIERRNSAGNIDSLPRKVLLDQLSSVLSSDEALPDSFILVNTAEWQGQLLAQVLQEPQHRVICTCSSADVKATISFVVNKIQKLHHLFRHPRGSFEQTDWTRGCNSNSRDPAPLKIAMAGGDSYVNQVLRPYVEQFSAKSHDWQNYIKFLYIPLGTSSLAKYLGSVDSAYSSLFCDTLWKETFEKSENQRLPDMSDIGSRVSRYLQTTCSVVQLPIAEAMITYKEKSTEDESSQTFVPFLTEVRIGPIDVPSGPSTSVDLEETGNPPPPQGALSSSPPQSMQMDKTKENHTPPSSPNVNHPGILGTTSNTATNQAMAPEFLELQLDYWTMERPTDLGPKDKLVKKDSKSSLKTTFKSVQVFRLPHATNGEGMGALSMMVITKEKKQKIMRIGKKSKENESKSQLVEGISRLICTSKSQSHPLTVSIDGVDWSGVKFFQVSSQWQTHIKHIPLLLMSHVESPL